MQQRGMNANMNSECEGHTTPPQPRGRNNSKSKILVRSHAMREETSPPREPTPTLQPSPYIKVIPSSVEPRNHSSMSPIVVLSPSISRNNSPSRTTPICISPTTTLIPSPTPKLSPRTLSPHTDNIHQSEFIELEVRSGSPKILNNNKINKHNFEKMQEESVKLKNDIIVEETSQINGSRKAKNDIYICNCVNQDCGKCPKYQDRNYNNNLSSNINNNVVSSSNTLNVTRANMRGKLRHQSSSQGSFEDSLCNSPCLSRDSSSEQYTDATGVDLELFIPETLNKNAKDRALMLRIEQELVNLAKDKNKTHYKFPPMSSYQRMLVHRCAAYFGMEHNIEPSGKCVLVNKTRNTRIPDVEFKQHIKEDIVFSEEPRRSILKRDSNSMEDYSFKSPDRQFSLENRRSKSIEEREEEYEKVRRRIFNKEMRECSSTDDFCWSEVPWSSTDSEASTRFRLQLPDHIGRTGGRLLKVQSEDTNEETLRPFVAKSYSFGGYGGVLTRGDSVLSTHSAGPRLLTKQDSAASSVSWRLSPSSSGYKTQSQRSESVTPSPTSTPCLSGESIRQDSTTSVATNTSDRSPNDGDEDPSDTQIVWVVTDIQHAPRGSIIINPQTGQPVKNQDGSIYHYDPLNPPPGFTNMTAHESKPPPSPQKSLSPLKSSKERPPSPKKRARSSPIKKLNLTNSSTSPSLPFSPPLHHSRNFSLMPSHENISNMPIQQQLPIYGSNYTTAPPDNSLQVYQQPCIVYAPYSIPVQYDGRIETQMPDVPGYYVNVPDTANNPTNAYQTPPPMWNQQPAPYYQNPHHPNLPPQRFAVPVPGQPGSFVSTTYPTNYMQHAPNPQNPDMVQLFSQQPVQMVYPPQAGQPNPVMFPPNQNLLYTHNPIYSSQVYPVQNTQLAYPQCTSTPNNCGPTTAFCGQFPEMNSSSGVNQTNFGQLTQSMNHMNISAGNNSSHMGQKPIATMTSFDSRMTSVPAKGNKFCHPKNFGMCSNSQSSTEASSPATTVISGYCQNQTGGFYRTPPETPPIHGYGNNFMPPVVLRQMSGVRASPPIITNRSSRSPTPSSDINIMERQRFSLPPTLYQGIPYVLQSDTRILAGRGQPNAYRQPIRQQIFSQGSEKTHKNRKGRGNKLSSLPPNGKQSNL